LFFPAVETVLEPLTSAIPEPLQQFLDINEMFQRIVEGVIDDSISTVLNDTK